MPRFTLGHRVEHLPWFARRYRGAFRSGSNLGSVTRFLNRVLYYAYDVTKLPGGRATVSLDVRGTRKSIAFDARNRQFNALYFRKFERGYEPDVTAVLVETLPAGGVFYDIGSNWGYFALMVASDAAFTGQVHAFEPFPPTYDDLESVIGQAGLTEVVTTHRKAIGEAAGTVHMACGRHSGLAHVIENGRGGVAVEQVALDDLELPPPSVMKVDAEGLELAIFRGGERLLSEHRPMLVFEHACEVAEHGALETLRYLESRQYRLFVPMVDYAVGGESCVALGQEAQRDDFEARGLRLHPMMSTARHVFAPYLNLFACHADRIGELEHLIIQ